MSSQMLVRNQAVSAIVETLYKSQLVEHLRRQLASFTRRWNNLPILLWRKMVAPNTAMHLDNFVTGTTIPFESVKKTLQKSAQQSQRVLGIILIMDNPHDQVSRIGVLARIRGAQWLGENCRVTIDGISRFTYDNLAIADGIMTANTTPIKERISGESLPVRPAQSVDEIPPPSPNTIGELERLSVQDQLRYAYGFVSEMMAHPEQLRGKNHLYLCGSCPMKGDDLPWWLAMALPFEPIDWATLLLAKSPRERLWVCCRWILRNQATLWTQGNNNSRG
ncbi:hypothetical protein V8C34DRAFT_269578 [Trichoderma compactum]